MSAVTLADVPIRNLIIEDIVERTGIDEVMIEHLVRTFYTRARFDPLIAPVFESRVRDWEGHIARMCAFWSSVALMSGRYHGQPMMAHLPLPIDTPYFDRWLEIFAETARDVCPPRRIARYPRRHPGHRPGRRRDGLHGVRGRDEGRQIVVEQSGPIRIVSARRRPCPIVTMPSFGRGQSVADACKGTRIP